MGDPKRTCDELYDLPRPLEEKQWTRLVREENDRGAFEKIFRIYYKRLYGFAYSYVGNRQEAEDIIQTVFLRIWAQKEEWDPLGTVKQYLFTAVRNEALNILRHEQVVEEAEENIRHLFRELKSSASSDDDEVEYLREEIQRGIDQLPPRCRQIFILNRRSGLTYSEIANFLNISVNTVGTQMGRALKSLQEHLADYLPFIALIELSGKFFL